MTSRTNGVIGFYIHLKKTERPCNLRKQKVTEFLIESYLISKIDLTTTPHLNKIDTGKMNVFPNNCVLLQN